MSDKIEYSRLLLKRTTETGAVPTVTSATTLNQLTDLDLLDGEIFLNTADERAFVRMGGNILEFNMSTTGTTDFQFCDTGIETDTITACTSGSNVTFKSNITIDTPGTKSITAEGSIYINTNGGTTRMDNLQAASISTDGGNKKWVYDYIDIGPWDMSATTMVNIAHNLGDPEFKTIAGIDFTIVDDFEIHYYSSNHPDIYSDWDSTNINITRIDGGFFEDTAFSSTASTRGFITFKYLV